MYQARSAMMCDFVEVPMTRRLVLGMLVTAGALSMAVAAFEQPPGQTAPMVVEVDKLKDNLYVMKGGGGNSAVFITADGVTE